MINKGRIRDIRESSRRGRANPRAKPVPRRIGIWTQLDRFLMTGSEGAYVTDTRKIDLRAARSALLCLQTDSSRFIQRVVEVSRSYRAASNDPALYCLALAMKAPQDPEVVEKTSPEGVIHEVIHDRAEETRALANSVLPEVARVGSHLFTLAGFVQERGGWGQGTKRAFARWYLDKWPGKLSYQLVKYQGRNGWTHRDILRLCKPKGHGRGTPHDILLKWATAGGKGVFRYDGNLVHGPRNIKGYLSPIIGYELAKLARGSDDVVGFIDRFGVPREAVPTEHLNDGKVWAALLANRGRGMPMGAMLRNLGKLSSMGLSEGGPAVQYICSRLTNFEAVKYGHLHPMQILKAAKQYSYGGGARGNLKWPVHQEIMRALDEALYLAFDVVEGTHKRILVVVDVAGAMDFSRVPGLAGLTSRQTAACLSMALMNANPGAELMGFCSTGGHIPGVGEVQDPPGLWLSKNSAIGARRSGLAPLAVSPKQRIDDVCSYMHGLPLGGCDVALPMIYALEKGKKFDAFVVITDKKAWGEGSLSPAKALETYRAQTGIDARLVVVGMVDNDLNTIDPDDPLSLNVVGMDTYAPGIISSFIRGEF